MLKPTVALAPGRNDFASWAPVSPVTSYNPKFNAEAPRPKSVSVEENLHILGTSLKFIVLFCVPATGAPWADSNVTVIAALPESIKE